MFFLRIGINPRKRSSRQTNSVITPCSPATKDGPIFTILRPYSDSFNVIFHSSGTLACLYMVHYSGKGNGTS